MRIITPDALSALTVRPRRDLRGLLRRIDHYSLWAFNAQPELTSRYDRAS